jgi:hypothetical protein
MAGISKMASPYCCLYVSRVESVEEDVGSLLRLRAPGEDVLLRTRPPHHTLRSKVKGHALELESAELTIYDWYLVEIWMESESFLTPLRGEAREEVWVGGEFGLRILRPLRPRSEDHQPALRHQHQRYLISVHNWKSNRVEPGLALSSLLAI